MISVLPLERARRDTYRLIHDLSDQELRAQPNPEYSPLGWHLGHIAFTEARWVFGELLGDGSLWESRHTDFAQEGRPKNERGDLPSRSELLDYLGCVRREVQRVLLDVPEFPGDKARRLTEGGYLSWFLAAHERQHFETMAIVRTLIRGSLGISGKHSRPFGEPPAVRRIRFEGGSFLMGTDALCAYDNEKPSHRVEIAPFELDATPVTCADFAQFMKEGGYRRPELFSEEGWALVEREALDRPFGWLSDGSGGWFQARLDGVRPLYGAEPVIGVSAYEAEAYARWSGARLPTEAEWEYALSCLHQPYAGSFLDARNAGPMPTVDGGGQLSSMIGNCWEWTETRFGPYPGFVSGPYEGYSAPYFDGEHRVVRGGSFATHTELLRSSFRNWYPQRLRSSFVGFRIAYDV
ncbi:MAG: SUMF1/EgtB/PvdO family nonheme iron enzyme [Myxococcota bacterium]